MTDLLKSPAVMSLHRVRKQETCGCDEPVGHDGLFCDRCRASLTGHPLPPDPVTNHGPVTQEEIAKKLGQLSDWEWARYPICGLPSRLQ